MSNWCLSTLNIQGVEKNILAVSKQLATRVTNKDYTLGHTPHKIVFSLTNIVSAANIKDEEWTDWHAKNWGTERDANEVEIVARNIGEISYDFQTAWSPPIAAIATLAKQWPSLRFILDYSERGLDFGGINIWEYGILTSESESICHNRWCYVCDENYIIPHNMDVDPGCTRWTQAVKGSYLDRFHLISDDDISTDEVMAILKETAAEISRINGSEYLIKKELAIFFTAIYNHDLTNEAIVFMHELGIEVVQELLYSLMDKYKLDSLFASTDIRLHAFASQALVYSSLSSREKKEN